MLLLPLPLPPLLHTRCRCYARKLSRTHSDYAAKKQVNLAPTEINSKKCYHSTLLSLTWVPARGITVIENDECPPITAHYSNGGPLT